MWRRRPAQRSQSRASDAVSGIGDILRRRRATLGLTLDDVHERIRVPVRLLEAIEADRFEAFGVAQYAKGFVRSYAQFLGLNPDPFVARIQVGPGRDGKTGLVVSGEVPMRSSAPPSPLRRALVWTAVIASITLSTIGYIGYRQMRQFHQSEMVDQQRIAAEANGPSGAPAPSVASPAPATDGSPPAGSSPAGPDAVETQLPPLDVAAESVIQVEMSSQDVCWVSVSTDGNRVFEGFLRAGERRRWDAAKTLSVVIGNATAVRISHNGRDLGWLGAEGEVVRRTFARGEPAGERNP
ncbi:MAG: helix-turn-helix domain-containing protein [Armatimonadetes bacterium]|nr:helix-turn-helix domain-containing protein [Armatimonadota bacterium]